MIFKALDPDMPDDEVEQIISEVDEDGSGTVDYEGKVISNHQRSTSSSRLFLSANRILQVDDRLKKRTSVTVNLFNSFSSHQQQRQ